MSADATTRRSMRLASAGPDDTRSIAAALAPALVVGDVLVLTGDLGAGKTCFTQGLGVGLGVDEPITSPTFTLANRYRGRLTLHHLDAYRLEGEADAGDLDLDDLVDSGVTVIEWGDRIAGLLPSDRFDIALRYPDLGPDEPSPDAIDEAEPSDENHQADELDRRILVIEGPDDDRRWDDALRPWAEAGSGRE